MAYEKQEWIDYPDETTPISAERLLHMEDGIEDANNAYLEYKSDYYTSYDRTIASQRLGISSNTEDTGNPVTGAKTLMQLKSYIDAKTDAAIKEDSIYAIAKDSYETLSLYHVGEGGEEAYYSPGTTRPYAVNNMATIPTKYASAIPKKLIIYNSEYGYKSEYTLEESEYDYFKYNGNIMKTYQADVTSADHYFIAFYNDEFHIARADSSYMNMSFDHYTRIQLDSYNYVYFPFGIEFEIPEQGNEITFSNTGRSPAPTDMPIYYDDNGTNTAYTYIFDSMPFMVYSASGDFTDKKIKTITFDGASLTQATLTNDPLIANSNSLNNYQYMITPLDSNNNLLCIFVPVSGALECWIAKLVMDTHKFSTKNLTASTTLTIEVEDPSIIDDTAPSLTTTYSSTKIEALIANLQAQINALS